MPTLTLLSFVFFTGLVGYLSWRLTREASRVSSEGYFLAGRTLTGGYIAGSLMLTNLSTEQLVGLNGAAFTDGLSVMAWEVVAAVALVVMALFFLPRYLKSGIATIPEYLEQRYDATTRAITSFIFIIAYAAILLPIILYTGATGLAGILNLSELTGIDSQSTPLWITVIMIGVLGSIYAIFGGLRTIAVSDTINGFGLLAGGLLITWFGLSAVGDGSVWSGLSELRQQQPQHFNSLGSKEQSVPFSTLFSGVLLLNLFYWCTNQQIIQRTFGASSLAEGQRGVLMAGGLKILGPLILVLPGIIAFHLFVGSVPTSDLAVATLAPDHAYGALVRHVLPTPLVGFFAAALVGAILSSFNSALNSTATLFSLGVYQPMLRPQASDADVIRVGKIFAAAIAIIAMLLAPALMNQGSIFGYLQKMNGLYFIPIFAVVLVGMISKYMPAVAAKWALLVGFVSIAGGYFFPPFAHYVNRIHEFHFLGVVFAALVAIMFAIRLYRPTAIAWQQHDSNAVDLQPWRHARWVGGLLLVLVISIYAAFANPSS
ncbi:MAG: solute:sodium symporter family transporter [Planctomycetes bacterium]|nr:solute:sodium symporter family transporter [Planctomycetota bacterium]